MRPGKRSELERLLAELTGIDGPIPSNEAPDETWHAWADYQELESIAVGLASRPRWSAAAPALRRLRELLAQPDLRLLLQDRALVAEHLVAALEERHR